MPEIVIVRHGDTTYTAPEKPKTQGLSDTRLVPQGILDSFACGKTIAERGIHYDHIYVSPQIRALQTLSTFLQGMQAYGPNSKYIRSLAGDGNTAPSVEFSVVPVLRENYHAHDTGSTRDERIAHCKHQGLDWGTYRDRHYPLDKGNIFHPDQPYMQGFLQQYGIELPKNPEGEYIREVKEDRRLRRQDFLKSLLEIVSNGKNVLIIDHGCQEMLEGIADCFINQPKTAPACPLVLQFDENGNFNSYQTLPKANISETEEQHLLQKKSVGILDENYDLSVSDQQWLQSMGGTGR